MFVERKIMKISGRLSQLIYSRMFAVSLWFGLSIIAVVQSIITHIHTLHSGNLYIPYPRETTDVNLYGPFFSLIIAAFSWLPDNMGVIFWVMLNSLFLLFAILKLPLPDKWKTLLVLLNAHESMVNSASLQTNGLVASCILLGFIYTKKTKESHALFFIMAAFFIKIYGIVGFAFFFFSRKKIWFIVWSAVWTILFFFAPLVITDWNFLVQSYFDWYRCLQVKWAKNGLLTREVRLQNVSVMGMFRRIFYLPAFNDLWILIPAFFLYASQYVYYRYWQDTRFQLYILCSVLIATVIFSNSSESATYIIAMPGLCTWYLLQPKSRAVTTYFIIAFIITSFGSSDLFSPWPRTHIFNPYSLKAFFPLITWLIILFQIHSKQFLKAKDPREAIP